MQAKLQTWKWRELSTNPLLLLLLLAWTRLRARSLQCTISEEEPTIFRCWKSQEESSKWKPPMEILPSEERTSISGFSLSWLGNSRSLTTWTFQRTSWLSSVSEKPQRRQRLNCHQLPKLKSICLIYLLTKLVLSICKWPSLEQS